LVVLSPGKQKQMISNAHVNEWMNVDSSIVLDVAQILNCHEWMLASTVPN
jgi:hypothetical protein